MAISDFLEAAALNHLYRGAASPRADTYFVALYTADPTDADAGAEVDTAVWTNYARASVDASAASSIFAAAVDEAVGGGMEVVITAPVSFGTPTITGTPPDVTHWGVRDAAVGGNLLDYAPLTTPKTITDGDPVEFATGDLAIIRR